MKKNAVMSINETYYTPDGVVNKTFFDLDQEFLEKVKIENDSWIHSKPKQTASHSGKLRNCLKIYMIKIQLKR